MKRNVLPQKVDACFCGSVKKNMKEMIAIKHLAEDLDMFVSGSSVFIPEDTGNRFLTFWELHILQNRWIRSLCDCSCVYAFPKNVENLENGFKGTVSIIGNYGDGERYKVKLLPYSDMVLNGYMDRFEFGESTSYEIAMARKFNKQVYIVLNGKEILENEHIIKWFKEKGI